VNGEQFKILIQLSLSSGETIENNTFCWFGFFNFFLDDLGNNLITHKSSRFDDSSNLFNQIFIKGTTDCSLKNFTDLITSWDVIVSKIFSEPFSISSLSYSWSTEEEKEFLTAGGEVANNSGS